MKASTEEQSAILDVARLDLQLSTLTNRANTLPELASLREITLKANASRDLRIAAETELSDVSRELARAEADVEQIVTRIQRDEKRLAEGAGTPKDLEHMQHELGSLGGRRAELEEAELEIMMRVDALKARITALKGEEESFAAEMATLERAKAAALTAIDAEKSVTSAARASAISNVSPELSALYAKIAEDNFGIGAAALVGNECKGCNLTLNTIEVQRISALPDDEVVRCEQCRCILVRN